LERSLDQSEKRVLEAQDQMRSSLSEKSSELDQSREAMREAKASVKSLEETVAYFQRKNEDLKRQCEEER
jgi:chromosome segregation ATPase